MNISEGKEEKYQFYQDLYHKVNKSLLQLKSDLKENYPPKKDLKYFSNELEEVYFFHKREIVTYDYINESKCLFFLLGNKSVEDDINVSDKNIKNFMRKNPKIKKYFDVSALNGHNIDIAFDKISQYLIMTFGVEEINKNIKEYKKNISIKNDDRNHNANKVKCC